MATSCKRDKTRNTLCKEQFKSLAILDEEQAHDTAGSGASFGLEETIWLCPSEDRCRLDSAREGMLEGFSPGSVLK